MQKFTPTPHPNSERITNDLLDAFVESAIDGILVVGRDGDILLHNKRFGEIWQIPAPILATRDDTQLLQYVLPQIIHAEAFLKKTAYLYAHPNETSREEIELTHGRWLDRYSSPLINASGTYHGRIWYFRDITEHKQLEADLQKSVINQHALLEFNTLLGQANQSIIHINKIPDLLQTMCELAVRHTAIRLAWIGQPDTNGSFQVLAAAGATDYLTDLHISIRPDLPEGQGPAGQAWRTQSARYSNMFANHSYMAPWHRQASQFGLLSSTAIPIFRNQQIWAIFSFYLGVDAEFTQDLRNILDELGRDISFGLDYYDTIQTERATQTFNDALLNSLTVGTNVMRYPERIIERVNQRMVEIYGASSENELIGHTAREFYPDEDTLQKVGAFAKTVLDQGAGMLHDVPYRRLDGSIIYIDLAGKKFDTKPGEPDRIVWTHIDVTERYLNQQSIKQLSENQRALLANTAAGIDMVQYPERIFVQVNQGFLDLLGYQDEREVLHHKTAEIYPHHASNQRMVELSQHILKEGHGAIKDLAVQTKDGRQIYVDLTGQRLLTNVDHPLIVWTSVEVTERHHMMEAMRQQALTDMLTGLPNRRSLDQELDRAFARAHRQQKRLALCVLDLDNFKPINDMYGHDKGDVVLTVLSQRFRNVLRAVDFVARLGGDEFVILVENLEHINTLTLVLEKVEQAAHAPIVIDEGVVVTIGISIGVAIYDLDRNKHESEDTLLRLADQALYDAKSHKHDRTKSWVFFGESPRLHRNPYQTLLDNGGLEIWYQPVLANKSRQIVGVEALARLRNADGKHCTPDEFLPHFDQDDLSTLFFCVMHQSIQDMLSLDELGLSLWVSINVDPKVISDAYVQKAHQQLVQQSIHPNRIVLEILEGNDFSEPQVAIRHFQQLKALGVRLALDDVGSAYSSLLRIKDLPIDEIKLDQNFVRTLETRPEEIVFVASIHELATGLGLNLVVEGVETDDILDVMSVMGIELLQGYAISKPIPINELREFLTHPPRQHRAHPTSLLGLYTEHVLTHHSLLRASSHVLGMLDYQTVSDANHCALHDHLQQICPDADIETQHAEYHHQLALAISSSTLDVQFVIQSSQQLGQSIMERYRKQRKR